MELLTDSVHRLAYATDGSIYRELPIGVAYPRTEDDIRQLFDEARRRQTYLIPRAGGTSVAGQVVGKGIVVDVSRYMNRILEIDAEHKRVRVQPGVVRDELNLALKPYGLFFSPETSTSNRCCIGGMVGNNSCGTHSLIYYSTRQHVESVRVILTDGTAVEMDNAGHIRADGQSGCLERIMAQLESWQNDASVCSLIAESFPDMTLRRRSCGYALDECLNLPLRDKLNLPALLCGSEGTLAFITEITLSLDVLPPKEVMVVCAHLDDMSKSWRANLIALNHHPSAVELIDGKIIDLCQGNIEAQKNSFFVDGSPKAIVVAEFRGETVSELDQQAESFEREVRSLSYSCTRAYGKDVSRVWALRKAGLGVLAGMPGDAKPVGVIEDTAVSPQRLEAYMQDFGAMMSRLHLDCVYYGHISTGELHLRPILNVKLSEHRTMFREVAEETAVLVKKHHGSLSGEHGDGRLRGEFIPLMYGAEVYEMFRLIKHVWDPDGILNIGKIVDTEPMDTHMRYEVGQRYALSSVRATHLSDGISGLMERIEKCNGAGDCRKSTLMGGTLCPAYKVSGDETKTTRARANILREVLTRGTLGGAVDIQSILNDESISEVLESCLACKGCRSECPSNVDMTRLRSEVLQMKYDARHVPFRVWMISHMTFIARIGSLVPHVYNFFANDKVTSYLLKRLMGFAIKRHIPSLSRYTLRHLVRHEGALCRKNVSKGKIYLFADEFTNYQESELGLAFVRLARGLGYDVEIPKHVESGRAAISKGCVRQASGYARKNVSLLKGLVSDNTPLVGIEPSCILSFRDEYPHLVPKKMYTDALRTGANALLYDEWLVREMQKGNISSDDFKRADAEVWLHGHCHQKALVGMESTVKSLQMIPGLRLHLIPSGCCGMAGSFGYEQVHYQTSMAIGETVLFPSIRKAEQLAKESHSSMIVCAPGTSCRQQIKDGTGIVAQHPIEVLAAYLKW